MNEFVSPALALATTDQINSIKRLILRKEVERRTSMPRSTLYEYIKSGKFPKPIRLTPRLIAFVEAEVDEWISQRIAERDAAQK